MGWTGGRWGWGEGVWSNGILGGGGGGLCVSSRVSCIT